ncbi:MAG: hypothetical protein ACRC46_08125 [Thermoguttaceae bacterium]
MTNVNAAAQTASQLSSPAPRIKRWWTFPTQIFIVVCVVCWIVSQYTSLIPRAIEVAVSRATSGDLKCGAFGVRPLAEQVTVAEIDWKHRLRDAVVQRVTAEKITANVSLWDLLFRRIHLPHLTIEGSTVSINDATSPNVARQVFGLAPLIPQNATRPLIRDEVALLLAGQPDMLTPILAQKLQTYRVAQELRAKWQPQWDRAEQIAKTIRQRIDTVRASSADPAGGGLAALPQILAEATTLQQQIKDLADDLAKLQSQSQGDIARLQEAIAADKRTLQSLTLPPLELDSLSEQLIGTDLITMIRNILANQKELFTTLEAIESPAENGANAASETANDAASWRRRMPISAGRIDFDGTILLGDFPLYYRGVVREVALPRDRTSQPLTAQICIDPVAVPDTVAAASDAASEHSPLYINLVSTFEDGLPRDRLTIQQPSYRMPEMTLGDQRTLALVVGAMNVRIDAILERHGEAATLSLRLVGENASIRPIFPPQLAESPVGRQLTSSLGGLRTVIADIRIEDSSIESGGEPKIVVQSNVAELVSRSLQGVIGTEWDRVRESLSTSIQQQSSEVLAGLTGSQGDAVLESLRNQISPLLPAIPATIPILQDRAPEVDRIWGTIRDAIKQN